jgi:hypothetical protein
MSTIRQFVCWPIAVFFFGGYKAGHHVCRRASGKLLLQFSPSSLKSSNAEPSSVILEYGVPHCSVLGPLIFILYSSPLSQIIGQFGIKSNFFSNDTQLYMCHHWHGRAENFQWNHFCLYCWNEAVYWSKQDEFSCRENWNCLVYSVSQNLAKRHSYWSWRRKHQAIIIRP